MPKLTENFQSRVRLRAERVLGISDWNPPPNDKFDLNAVVRIDELGVASADGDGLIRVRSRSDCWVQGGRQHAWCRGSRLETWHLPVVSFVRFRWDDSHRTEVQTAARLNAFLADEEQKTFVLRRPTPIALWHLLFYVAAVGVACLNVRRTLALKTNAWLRAVKEIPASKALTPYRG